MRAWIDRRLFTHKAKMHGNFKLLKLRISAACNIIINFDEATTDKCGPGSSVGMSWTVRGSNPGGCEIFRTRSDRPWGPPSLLYNGYRVFPEGKERPERDAEPSPPYSAVVMKGHSYTCTPPMDRTACTEPQCLYKVALYFTFY
jgi:hypothetical protein